jgi:hypothetical protein
VAEVTQTFVDRWRSRHHIGSAKPQQYARVRKGRFERAYRNFTFLDGSTEEFAFLPGTSNAKPWAAKWVPQTAWVQVPNLREADLEQSFDNNGFITCTLVFENIIYKQIAGVVGTYHAVKRGYLSPWMGFRSIIRASQFAQNEWYELLDGGCQIEVWQGYGDQMARTFTGLIDDVDMTSKPDQLTVTARCFGANALGEQRVYGYNKDPRIRPPITFADRFRADKVTKISGGASASSSDASHPPSNVTKPDQTFWMSDGHANGAFTEWVDIRLKHGRYETFFVQPQLSGMEMYLSIYASGQGLQGDPQLDDVDITPGWIDTGLGNVPGANGGFPYIKRWDSVSAEGRVWRIGHKVEIGDNSILRVSFRNLGFSPARQDFRAAVRRLVAYHRLRSAEARKNNWILVDDAADVVKVVLRWAGFREWEVENFGVRLKENLVFHQADYLIDIINKMKEQGNYNFFMADPTSHDESLGVPVFRNSRAMLPPGPRLDEVKDSDLLTGISVKLTKGPKAHIIRARGAEAKLSEGGILLGEDTTRRVTAHYRPPWTIRGETAGIIRHTTHVDRFLKTEIDCMMACVLIAVQQALMGATGGIEIPGFPKLELDQQISVVDEGTGANTRLWIASRSSTFSSGQQAKWTTQLGGSWLDTQDLIEIAFKFFEVRAEHDAQAEYQVG